MNKNKHCGDCKYIGADTGECIGEQPLHFCENGKSIFKVCLETASSCECFEKEEETK